MGRLIVFVRRLVSPCCVVCFLVVHVVLATMLCADVAFGIQVGLEHKGKPMITIDGKPTPLFFSCGLTSHEDLEEYAEAGFNTVWVDVRWGEDVDEQMERVEGLLKAAHAKGLFAIVCINAVPPTGIRMSVYDERYVSLVRSWIPSVIGRLGKHRNIVAWATTSFPDEMAVSNNGYDDEGFRRYLLDTYGDVETLSRAFGVPITNPSQLTQQLVMNIDDLQSPTLYGHSSLSASIYRWCSLRWLMQLWYEVIRQSDGTRPIITGLLSTYRSIASVPAVYDGVTVAPLPSVCEPDLDLHNAHAVAIGRMGNAKLVLSVITSSIGGKKVSLKQLVNWVQAAVFNGACGIGFTSWEPFKNDPELRGSVSELLKQMNDCGILCATPITHTAILYMPFAEGYVRDGVPLYGFATPNGEAFGKPYRLILGEPNSLFSAFKLGTRYGLVDCLTLDALTKIAPQSYSCILTPAPILLSPHVVGEFGEELYGFGMPRQPRSLTQSGSKDDPFALFSSWLMSFVANGGVLLSDIGVSLSPAGHIFRLMPADFAKLFGVVGARMLIVAPEVALSMSVLYRHPLFPSLYEGYLLGGDELPFRTIAAVLHFVGAKPYALMMRHPRRTRRLSSEAVAMCINSFGKGFAVYAPTLLWANWRPYSKDFALFHGDLFSAHSEVELLSAHGLLDDEMKVALFDRGIAILNLSDRTKHAVVRVEADAINGSSLPNACVEYPHGSRSQSIIIHKFIQPLELAFVKSLPILVSCNERFVALVSRYDDKGIALRLYGNDATVGYEDGRFVVSARRANYFRLSIFSGEYEIKPNSRHAIALTLFDPSAPPERMEKSIKGVIVANSKGVLELELKGAVISVDVHSGE